MITPAQPKHAQAIAQVIHASITACEADHHNDPNELAAWLANKTADNITQWLTNNFAVVFEQNQAIVGVLMVSPKGEVLLNYVDPTQQGQGIGKAMMDAAISYANEQHLDKLYLESTLTAKDFYQKQQFITHHEVIENGKLVAFCMQRLLESAA